VVIDRAAVHEAIVAAERRTSGEIVVSVAPWFWGSVERTAARAFAKLGVARLTERNGVLLFVCPRRRRFVVLGDDAIHDRAGQPFWDAVVASIGERFRARDLTGGIVHGISMIGNQLAKHFPREATGIIEA
jgi:uncharacterized membrane protein